MDRRHFLAMATAASLAGCGDDDSGPMPPPEAQVDQAIAALDGLASELMEKSGVPGMAVAVVRGTQKVYARGFGVRVVDSATPVDADTVFQLASMSKSVGATVVARQIGLDRVQWDTPVHTVLPWFALADPAVTAAVTIGDLYAHRSGLPAHAGDLLEDMGYDRRSIVERLRFEHLDAFRTSYHYGNFDVTAAGEAVATAVGVDWATLCDISLYQRLGMTRTTSRFAQFIDTTNRARGHVLENGRWLLSSQRRNADVQAPAGGVGSSVNDVAKWLALLLGGGTYQGERVVEAAALEQAVSPHIAVAPGSRFYNGFGFIVSDTMQGRRSYSHSGSFALGAATAFKVVPSTGLGIVVLTNGAPIGVPETLLAEFFDLVEAGRVEEDYYSLYRREFAEAYKPSGSLVGVPPPANPAPPSRPLTGYTGIYANTYYGPATVTLDNGGLLLRIGPAPIRVPLMHWDGDEFVFHLENENALPGTISKATFDGDALWLEYYSDNGFGTFVRAA